MEDLPKIFTEQNKSYELLYETDIQYQKNETDAKLAERKEWFGTRRIGLAVVGIGRMGAIHLGNVLREPRANPLYVVDASKERLDYMRKKYFLDDRGIQTLHTDDWQTVLKDKRVEAVLILTPTYTHEQYVREALNHNKHIICEKPLAKNLDAVKALVKLAKDKNLVLICAFNRRYDPSFRCVQKQILQGDIGQVRVIKTCSRDSPLPPMEYIRVSGGIFHDCCSHDIDITLWIARELPVEVHAYAHTYSDEYKKCDDFDTVVCTLKFKSGLMSMTDLSRLSATGYEQRFEVFGPKGVLKIDEHARSTWERHSNIGVTKPNQCFSFASRFQEAYSNEITELFNHIEGNKTMEKINEKYLPALCKIITGLEESARTGRAINLEWTAEEADCFS